MVEKQDPDESPFEWVGIESVPKLVYKFIEPTYSDLFSSGQIRIGTFRGYADMDNERRDAEEASVTKLISGRFTAQDEIAKSLGFDIRDQAQVFVEGMRRTERMPDMFCFCVSLGKEAAPPFEHVLFQIENFPQFLEALIAQCSSALGPACHLDPVSYRPRVGNYDDPNLAGASPFIKDTTFAWERGYRAVWSQPYGVPAHSGTSLEPFVTEASQKLAKYISRIAG